MAVPGDRLVAGVISWPGGQSTYETSSCVSGELSGCAPPPRCHSEPAGSASRALSPVQTCQLPGTMCSVPASAATGDPCNVRARPLLCPVSERDEVITRRPRLMA